MKKLSTSQRLLLARMGSRFQMDLMGPDGADRLAYLVEERGISEQSIAQFQLGAVLGQEAYDFPVEPIMQGRVAIPFITPTGVVALRYMLPPPRDRGPKYWQPEGTVLGIYNTPVIAAGGPRIAIVEGEMDTIILNQIGIPAVGIPGANAWRDHYHAVFDGYTEVIIIGDNDEKDTKPLTEEEIERGMKPRKRAGEMFVETVAAEVPNPRIVMMPRGFDVNDLYKAQGADAVLDLIKMKKGWA